MGASPTSVLVIDDDRLTRRAVAEQLESTGCRVHEAEDGIEGLEATFRLRPQLVFCDWNMPRLDGLDYCRRVKADPRLRSVHVTLLTGRGEIDDKVVGLDAGADDFLVKPVAAEELLARTRAGLRSHQLRRQLADEQRRDVMLQLSSRLGHELNNPLTALFGHLELLEQYLEAGDRERMLHHIRSAGEMARRLADVGQHLNSKGGRDPVE